MRCPSARALIKPHTLHHLLITSKQQQESSPGQHLWMRGQGTKRQADRKWQQVSPLLIQGPCGPMVHSRGSIAFSSSSHKHATTEICTEKKGRGENARGPKHFTQSILVVSSFAGLVVTTLLHTHKQLQTSANRASKLVTLFLIGIKIPSSFPSQQPLKGNADWLALWYPLSSDPHPASYKHTLSIRRQWCQLPVDPGPFTASCVSSLHLVTDSVWECIRTAGLRRPAGRICLAPSSCQLVPCPCGAVAPSQASPWPERRPQRWARTGSPSHRRSRFPKVPRSSPPPRGSSSTWPRRGLSRNAPCWGCTAQPRCPAAAPLSANQKASEGKWHSRPGEAALLALLAR